MGVRLTFLTILCVMLTFPAVAGGVGVTKLQAGYFSQHQKIDKQARGAAVGCLPGKSGLPFSHGNHGDGAQIHVVPDVAMYGSDVFVCDSSLSIIAIIHQQQSESFPPAAPCEPLRVLFMVVISPNAP